MRCYTCVFCAADALAASLNSSHIVDYAPGDFRTCRLPAAQNPQGIEAKKSSGHIRQIRQHSLPVPVLVYRGDASRQSAFVPAD
ncbi:hypothetical protein DSN37_09100 [Salmonella enterica subsp. enterica serovar Kuessel]|nr:hypothetical protein [Salmonella enterica subsp. houtenae serovar 44:z4,z23:-]EBX5570237.1 hypothetical protein [Salmonella enterica subsp. enterica serovar Kuessel]EBZ2911811.1 hypothetical protein [Salmonella enterica subsp. enterica serovar Mesbit]